MTNMRIVSDQDLTAPSRNSQTLEDLTALVGQLTERLNDLGREIHGTANERSVNATFEPTAGVDIRIDVRSARRLRNLRKRIFGADIHSGPAWDILLHLFESHVLQQRDTVGNVTDGTELPGATALRWIARLQEEGLVSLHDDHLDRRRRFVELTATGVELMTRYFSGAAPHLIAA